MFQIPGEQKSRLCHTYFFGPHRAGTTVSQDDTETTYPPVSPSPPPPPSIPRPTPAQGTHLSNGVWRQNLLLHLRITARLADGGKVPHGIASRHCLSSTRLPAYNYWLIFIVSRANKWKDFLNPHFFLLKRQYIFIKKNAGKLEEGRLCFITLKQPFSAFQWISFSSFFLWDHAGHTFVSCCVSRVVSIPKSNSTIR